MPKNWRKPRLPAQLAKLLREKRRANPHAFFLIKTDATCTDRRIGALMAKYLFRELNDIDRRAFERHIRSCIPCAAAIHHMFELQRALKSERSEP